MDERELISAFETALKNTLHADFQRGGAGTSNRATSGGFTGSTSTGGATGGGGDGGGVGLFAAMGNTVGKFTDLNNSVNTLATIMGAANGNLEVASLGLVSNIQQHGAALLSGQNSLSDHTGIIQQNLRALIPANSALGGLTDALVGSVDILQNNYNAFKALSEVGASFGGDLLDLQQIAHGTRMNLDEFAKVVGGNTERLIALGPGVSGGARAFSAFSRAFFDSRANENLQALGIGTAEVNEYLLDQLSVRRRDDRFQQMSADEQIAATAEYVRELDVLAKLTGRQRQEIQDEMMARQAQGGVQAVLRQMENNGIEGAAGAYMDLQQEMEGMPAGMKELQVSLMKFGAPVGEAQENLAALFQESTGLMSQANAAFERGDFEAANDLMAQAKAAALATMNTEEYLSVARLEGLGGVADTAGQVMGEMAPMIDALNQFAESTGTATTSVDGMRTALDALTARLEDEQAVNLEEPIVNAFAGAEATIRDAGTALTDAFIETFRNPIEGSFAKLYNDAVGAANVDPVAMQEAMSTLIGRVGEMFGVGLQGTIDELNQLINDENASAEQKQLAADTRQAIIGLLDEYNAATTDAERQAIQQQISDLQTQAENVLDAVQVTNESNRSIGESISSFMGGIGELLSSGFSGLFGEDGLASQAYEGVKNFFGGFFDAGGRPPLNRVSMVGESGPEMFIPDELGTILPADMTSQLNSAMQQIYASNNLPAVAPQETPSVTDLQAQTLGGMNQNENPVDTLNRNMLQLIEINRRTMEMASRQLNAIRGMTGNVYAGTNI